MSEYLICLVIPSILLFHKTNNCKRKVTTTNPLEQLLLQTLYMKRTQAYSMLSQTLCKENLSTEKHDLQIDAINSEIYQDW